MSSLSDKFSSAYFEGVAVTTDSKGSNTLTNNNTVSFSGGVATFEAAAQRSLSCPDASSLSLGDKNWFAQWRGTLLDKATGTGQTLYSKDDTSPNREQQLVYLNSTDRIFWDLWAAQGGPEIRLVIGESPPEDVEFTVQVWYDKTAGSGSNGAMFGRINLGTVYSIDAPNHGWDSGQAFRIGSLEDLSAWFYNGLMSQLIVGNGVLPTSTERDWMIDKSWTQIEAGPASPFIPELLDFDTFGGGFGSL
jgi:hypothetical protein